MNELIKIENDKELGPVVSSRTVAQELVKRHADVLKQIENILTNEDFRSLVFESNYIDSKGESRKEYLLTKDGFTLYMFNIQGHNDFKIAYINRFNEMEQAIKENNIQLPSDPMEVLELMFNANKQTNEKVSQIEAEVIDLKENVKLDAGEYGVISRRVSERIRQTIKNYALSEKAYGELAKDLNGSIKKLTNTSARTQLRQKHFDLVMDFINNWEPSTATLHIVRQMDMEDVEETR